MKRILLAVVVLISISNVNAETFRVNNATGSGAQYKTVKEAMDAANDGDVIIVDGSSTSYGDLDITKKITLKGPGYFLGVNDVTKEDVPAACFENVKVKAAGAKITGIAVNATMYLLRDEIVVVRNYIRNVSVKPDFSFSDTGISKCVIHQNYILNGISGDNYSVGASYMQITNNIIAQANNAHLYNLENSLISRNSFIVDYPASGVGALKNCTIENNIGYQLDNPEWNNRDNTYSNNFNLKDIDYNKIYGTWSTRTETSIKLGDESLTKTAGAFSGDDPYLFSGLPTGPMIQDIEMPESVAQGEDLKVTIKIGLSK